MRRCSDFFSLISVGQGRVSVVIEGPRFIGQHDRNAVADRNGEAGLVGNQLLTLAIVATGRFRHRADQNFQKLRIDFSAWFLAASGHSYFPVSPVVSLLEIFLTVNSGKAEDL